MEKRDLPLFFALMLLAAAIWFNVIAARQCPVVYGLPTHSSDAHGEASGDQHPSPSATARGLNPAQKLENGTDENGCAAGVFGIPPDGWVALFTLALTVATVGLYWVTRSTWVHAQESSERQLRAYVFLESHQMHWLHKPDDPSVVSDHRLSLIWKNSGQTPARNVKVWLNFAVFENGKSPEDIGFPDLDGFNSAAGPIGPGQTIISRRPLSVSSIQEAWKGTKDLYYWAWIEYDDTFPNTGRRRTELCARIWVNSDPSIKQPLSYRDAYVSRFNAFDRECVHRPKT